MKKHFLFVSSVLLFVSCRFIPGDDSKHESFLKEGPAYKLVLNPASGSKYRYKVLNETETVMEVNEKKISNENNSNSAIVYTVNRDSAGDVLLAMEYEKVALFIKNDQNETELDADNAAFSTNPVEQLLGALKSSKINVHLNINGSLKSVAGYKELADNIFSKLKFTDASTASIAREQWDKTIEASMIRKNIDQFFKIFPDSMVHLREKWRIESSQKGEFGLKVITTYFVKAITDKEVFIESYSDIVSDNNGAKLEKMSTVSNLKGEQTGEYVMELNTGMLLSARINSKINGTVTVRGMDVPLKIKSKITLDGTKVE